jgi:hypothetical protein
MTGGDRHPPNPDEAAVLAKLRQPHLLTQLAENSLTIADSLRSNYFNNTAKFVATSVAAFVGTLERAASRSSPPCRPTGWNGAIFATKW